MKEITLSQYGKGKSLNLVALVDDEDFEWLNQWNWFADKYKHSYYAGRNDYTTSPKRCISMHRQILGLTDPNILVDHKDHNGLNNQRNNIRVANKSQNAVNTFSHGTSKYLGVSWKKRDRKWVAQITKDYQKKWIGYFDNEHDAAIAYNKKAIELFGEFANLNKITA